MPNEHATPALKGVRLSRLNILFIITGLVIMSLMVYTMYQTIFSVNRITTVTQSFLTNQQAGGMLNDLSEGICANALGFVQTGEPQPARAFAGQMDALDTQRASYVYGTTNEKAADDAYREATDAWNRISETNLRAMRLKADTLPGPLFEMLPEMIRDTELPEEDQALTPGEKEGTALSLLTSEEYLELKEKLRNSIDENHRVSSIEAQKTTASRSARIRNINRGQKILVFLFILTAVAALIANWYLMLSPIRKSVTNLDQREPIPVRGSYEMRHLAEVYNDVLQENETKEGALSFNATHDALTGLNNRTAFDSAYREMKDKQIGIVIADIDHFKRYNDEYGHDIGDRVLRMTAEALIRNFREEDIICRIGGDEFCVIMPGRCHADGQSIREKIHLINQELKNDCGELPPVTITAGVAFWNRPDPGISIFKDADRTLLELKKRRNDCCGIYP